MQETARERGKGWKIESNQEAYKQQAAFDKGFYFLQNRTKKNLELVICCLLTLGFGLFLNRVWQVVNSKTERSKLNTPSFRRLARDKIISEKECYNLRE